MREISLGVMTLVVVAVLWLGFFMPGSVEPETAGKPAVVAPPPALTEADVAAFYDAIDSDNTAVVESWLARYPKLIGRRAVSHGELPLHRVRSREMAGVLLAAGASTSESDREFHARPVRWAAAAGRDAVCNYLEGNGGGDPDAFYFATTGRPTLLAEAIKKDARLVSAVTADGDILGPKRTLLHLAAGHGQLEIARFLLDNGASPSIAGGRARSTPLHEAAANGNASLVELLLKRGADLSALDEIGPHQPLWYAATAGHAEVVRMLLAAGAIPEPGILAAIRGQLPADPTTPEKPGSDYAAIAALLKAAEAHPASQK